MIVVNVQELYQIPDLNKLALQYPFSHSIAYTHKIFFRAPILIAGLQDLLV